VTLGGRVAYVPQLPWIQHGTVRENILFGRQYEHAKYMKIVAACALTRDFEVGLACILSWGLGRGDDDSRYTMEMDKRSVLSLQVDHVFEGVVRYVCDVFFPSLHRSCRTVTRPSWPSAAGTSRVSTRKWTAKTQYRIPTTC
jgi:hypothetical protein